MNKIAALGGQGGFGGQGGLGGNNIQQLNGSNIQTTSENDFWSDLKEALKVLVSPTEGRQVVVSPQAGLVTVRALPSEIAVVKDFLNQSQESLQHSRKKGVLHLTRTCLNFEGGEACPRQVGDPIR